MEGSDAAAKAKEAEAAGSIPSEFVVSVVNVDTPPNYGEVAPGSPAPSYKSDMAGPAVPASPAPSYKSVDISTKEEQKGERKAVFVKFYTFLCLSDVVALEPVHEKKESLA